MKHEPLPPAKKKALLSGLWKYLKPFKGLIAAAVLLTLASNGLALVGPLLSGYAIDAIELGQGRVDFESVFRYTLLMMAFYAASSILGYILSVLMIKIGRNTVFTMREDILDKLSRLPVKFFDSRLSGDVISIVSYDIDTINSSISSDVVQVFTSLVTVTGSFIMMLTICPRLVLIFAVTIPVLILYTRGRLRKVRPLFKKRSEKLGRLNGYAEEAVTGQKTVKAYNREDYMVLKFDGKNSDAVEAGYNAEYYGSIAGPVNNFFNNASLALVCTFGSLLYLAGAVSLGQISSFVLYSRKFAGPINEFTNILNDLQSAFAAAQRVFSIIDEIPEPPDLPEAALLTQPKGNVSFENVSFSYDGKTPVLDNISFTAQAGSLTALVGPTGAGKTTIITLLMRFYDPDSGQITLDGRNIRDIKRDSLRSEFSMVLQDTWLFRGTVAENIAYGSDNVSREEIENAAKAAELHDYIMSLPDGYETLITDNGVNISKGQKQLMTIARAMLSPSKMLILDEATSNVDTATEQRLMRAVNRLIQGKTCFVIAHRLSTIENADNILVIDGGRIIESGTHRELLRDKGLYYKLYNSQFALL